MNSFDPAPGAAKPFRHPLSGLPELPGLRTAASAPSPPSPDDEACFALWRKYAMLPNVQRHSRLVAHIATALARRAAEKGFAVNVPEVRASALLGGLGDLGFGETSEKHEAESDEDEE